MKFLVLAAAVVLATGQDPPPVALENSGTSPHQDNSLMLTLLNQTDFSQFCISEALDVCSKQEKEGHFASLVEVMVQVLTFGATYREES